MTIGDTFGRLTVLRLFRRKGMLLAKAKCSCGETTTTRAIYLSNGHTKSCGCLQSERRATYGTHKPLPVGSKWGRFEVLRCFVEDGRSVAKVRCECGAERLVNAQNIRRGLSKSCGCLRDELARQRVTHGRSKTPEYRSWQSAKRRCFDPNDPAYRNYGGRGIAMCPEWASSFERFIRDMGPRPSLELTINRIDNEGHYEPGNCQWATDIEQANNRRGNRRVVAFGRSQSIRAWSDELGVPFDVIKQRLRVLKWTPEKAVTQPVRRQPNA